MSQWWVWANVKVADNIFKSVSKVDPKISLPWWICFEYLIFKLRGILGKHHCNGATAICLGVDLVVGDNVHHLRGLRSRNGRSERRQNRSDTLRVRDPIGEVSCRQALALHRLEIQITSALLSWVHNWDWCETLPPNINICSFQTTSSTTISAKTCQNDVENFFKKINHQKFTTKYWWHNFNPVTDQGFRVCQDLRPQDEKHIWSVSTVSTLLMVSLI